MASLFDLTSENYAFGVTREPFMCSCLSDLGHREWLEQPTRRYSDTNTVLEIGNKHSLL